MREIITQAAVAFILWSLAVEIAGWAMQRWLGDAWWRRLLGEREMVPEVCEVAEVDPQTSLGKYRSTT